jgi:hypothetical protein
VRLAAKGLWCYAHVDWLHRRGEVGIGMDEKPMIMDNGGSHITQDTQRYFAHRPRVRVLYPPGHASWLNQAELLLRAFTDKYLDRFDAESRQHLIDHLKASWREYNHRFAHPFEWSWTRRDLYT